MTINSWGFIFLFLFFFPNCSLMHEGGHLEMEPDMYKAFSFKFYYYIIIIIIIIIIIHSMACFRL